jgi:hypothetical protein
LFRNINLKSMTTDRLTYGCMYELYQLKSVGRQGRMDTVWIRRCNRIGIIGFGFQICGCSAAQFADGCGLRLAGLIWIDRDRVSLSRSIDIYTNTTPIGMKCTGYNWWKKMHTVFVFCLLLLLWLTCDCALWCINLSFHFISQ